MKNIPLSSDQNAPIVLDQSQRLSRSTLWRLQRNYFDRQGIRAWSRGPVPHYITTNPFIARAYARVVFGFIRDCRAAPSANENGDLSPLDFSQPVYIIELGSGSGRLAFHFLKKFADLYRRSVLKDVPFKYVMTDFAEQNIDYWRAHASLQPFVEQGVLDFARFDAEQDCELKLYHGGETLTAESVKNPMVVLANYFFDSIPQDVFYIEGGQLHECLVTLSSSQEETNLDDPEILDRIQIAYENHPTSPEYYDDPDLNRILQDYQQRLAGTTILFPCAALQCIRRLRQLSTGRMLLLSGDKGYIKEEALLGRGEPELNLHGSFSMMVNYHAIGQYFQNHGGHVLHAAHRHNSINICAFLLGDHPHDYVETRQAFIETIENCGPDDFYTLAKGVAKNYDALTLEQLLSLLRLSGWDAKIFRESFPALLNHVESAPPPLKQELYCALQQVWDNYYHIGEEHDLAFYMAMLLYGMQYYPEALEHFQRSLRLYGPDPSTFYNMAMCHYNLRQLEAALEYINQTLELDSTFEAAKAARIKLRSEIEHQAR
jgi:tetratricopeptide (TPR) repeat protein